MIIGRIIAPTPPEMPLSTTPRPSGVLPHISMSLLDAVLVFSSSLGIVFQYVLPRRVGLASKFLVQIPLARQVASPADR